ncbi:MAG: serine protease [Armatimonadota bacterium]|nr:serine protease [Armatimonadota bacterium]MCX7777207.1 serine protease [Armatimonadota bacterium]MDW8025034.1 serine protease [Armatimonadota bacterium]
MGRSLAIKSFFTVFMAILFCRPVSSNPFEDILSATVRIVVGGRSSTGFIVAVGDAERRRHLLVTAAHAFLGSKEQSCSVFFRVIGDGNEVKRAEKKIPIMNDSKPLWIKHPNMDLAILSLEPPENAILKPFSLQQIASSELVELGKIHVGQDVYIPCYPAKIESNPMGWAVLRRGIISSHPLAPVEKIRAFLVDYSTFGGDSGAPVVAFIDGKPIIVGIVVGMMRQTDVAKMPFEERVVHTPVGLAIVIHAHFAREVIEKVEK